jgi:phenylalanyl-tRNA synthetase beta chain
VVVAEIVDRRAAPERRPPARVQGRRRPHTADGPLQIVCGAPNARVGIRVPLATGRRRAAAGRRRQALRHRVGKLRGVESFGMLCSARELKLSDDHGGLLELAADAPLGQPTSARC